MHDVPGFFKAGHNTVVINEAFQTEDEGVINFSQLSHVAGTVGISDHTTSDDPGDCILLDGSAVYGSGRPDGWLEVMRRYSCSIGGTFVIIDVLAVKASREPLVLSGGAYNGPGFDEGETAHSELHLEEYFHVNTDAVMSKNGNPISAGASQASLGGSEHPFTPDSARTCAHVDATVKDGGASVLLEPRCGMSKGRAPDGSGSISGFAVGGGGFVYDGLVTSEDPIPHTALLQAAAVPVRCSQRRWGQGGRPGVCACIVGAAQPHERPQCPAFLVCCRDWVPGRGRRAAEVRLR